MKIAVDLTPVEETLLVPLWARAEEATRSDAVLRDPRAGGIRARLDYDFGPLASAQASQLGCCVRGRLMDSWLCGHLALHPGCTVVDLGCGLDGRFERADDGRTRWIDMDLPAVIDLRRRFFRDTGRRTMLAGSVLDEAWMDTVAEAAAAGPILFVTEGMLPYLQAEEVRTLLVRLADRFPGSTLLFDAMSPLVIRHQRHHDAMRHFEARFAWGLDDLADLEAWDPRIQLEETQRFHDLLRRYPQRLPRLVRWFGRVAGAVYPPFKRAYTLNRARLG